MYSILVTPYQIAFVDIEPQIMFGFEITIDILYFIDLIFNCFTAFYNDDNNLIQDHKAIIKKYARSWLLIDFISCCPIQIILDSTGTLNSMIKITRVQRL